MLRLSRLFAPPSTLRISPGTGPRIVVDLLGTTTPTDDCVVLSDLHHDDLDKILKLIHPGTSVEIRGLHVVPENVDSVARLLSHATKASRGLEICIDSTSAPRRWVRRLRGNLIRFGCIEPDEAISTD